jgi:hypothetical protein
MKATRRSRWVLYVYAAGFLVGAAAHARDILRRGFLPYIDAPLSLNVYWTSLVVLDLLVVLLIPFRPRSAALLAVAVMLSDMLVDFYAALTLAQGSVLTNFRLHGIVVFGIFVCVSAPVVWRQAAEPA